MQTPQTSSLFTPWQNPENGVTSYILSTRPAPVQPSFYYTQPTFSANGENVNIDASYKCADGSHVTLIGEMPLDGNPYIHWETLRGRTFDHGLFSPTDQELQLISHEFCFHDQYICHTTTIHGRVDVALISRPQFESCFG